MHLSKQQAKTPHSQQPSSMPYKRILCHDLQHCSHDPDRLLVGFDCTTLPLIMLVLYASQHFFSCDGVGFSAYSNQSFCPIVDTLLRYTLTLSPCFDCEKLCFLSFSENHFKSLSGVLQLVDCPLTTSPSSHARVSPPTLIPHSFGFVVGTTRGRWHRSRRLHGAVCAAMELPPCRVEKNENEKGVPVCKHGKQTHASAHEIRMFNNVNGSHTRRCSEKLCESNHPGQNKPASGKFNKDMIVHHMVSVHRSYDGY